MALSQIGIKIADGSFYPILDEGSRERKRLVVTTVKDNQENVHIDLYRSSSQSLDDANYVGSLVVESISPALGGEPEIEVFLGIDADNNLNAVASDTMTGNRQSLSTSLQSLDEQDDYTIPDFELGEEPAAAGTEPDELTGSAYPIGDEDRRKAHLGRGKNSILRIVFIVVGLLVIAGITYVLYRIFEPKEAEAPPEVGRQVELHIEPAAETPAESAASESPTPADAPAPEESAGEDAAESPAVAAADESAADAAAVESADAAPQTEGAWYSIKWGDTLWDISATYYRNPWLFPVIAEHPNNSIDNPDFILAGFKLFIPKR